MSMTNCKRDMEEWHVLTKLLALAELIVDQAKHQLERAQQTKELLENRMIDVEERLGEKKMGSR